MTDIPEDRKQGAAELAKKALEILAAPTDPQRSPYEYLSDAAPFLQAAVALTGAK